MTRALVLLAALAAVLACGRTSPDPCRAREGLPCAALAEERALQEADHAAAVGILDGDAVARQGACVQAIVVEQLEKQCLPDACAELCALHPCAVQGGGDCLERCNAVVASNEIARASLDEAILRAATDPALCTCNVCDAQTQALCDQVWVCE